MVGSLSGHLLAWCVASDDRLEAVFLAEVSPQDRQRFRDQLKTDLAAACARGRAAFAEVPLDDEIFVRHLARAAMRMSDGAALSALAAEDLYLACACLVGAPGAADALMAQQRSVIRRAIALTAPRANADEIEQGLLTDLLVGSPGRPPEDRRLRRTSAARPMGGGRGSARGASLVAERAHAGDRRRPRRLRAAAGGRHADGRRPVPGPVPG